MLIGNPFYMISERVYNFLKNYIMFLFPFYSFYLEVESLFSIIKSFKKNIPDHETAPLVTSAQKLINRTKPF